MKPIATDVHRNRREKLMRLCESPVSGEAEVARRKVKRLLAKYDFDTEIPTSEDLFARAKEKILPGKARLLFSFEPAETDVATFAQWAIEKSYSVSTCLRMSGAWQTAVWVEVSESSLPELQIVAGTIRSQFISLWETLKRSANVEAGDRRPFMLGLYDGMMDDPRIPGQRLPQRLHPKRDQGKGASKKNQRGAALASHPYTLAVDLGRKIRFSASLDETIGALEQAIAGALPNGAASQN